MNAVHKQGGKKGGLNVWRKTGKAFGRKILSKNRHS